MATEYGQSGDVAEAVLQAWFVEVAKRRDVCSHIANLDELRNVFDDLERQARITDRISRNGLRQAIELCDMLLEVNLLMADASVADKGDQQMRPDLVMFTESASYVLVELKARRHAERQGVQELLAYSAALKMQVPYINDFAYVIVANEWTTLLRHSVRALILDGKRVLPLTFTQTGADFELHVVVDLFQFCFEQPYDPWYALEGSTLAGQQVGSSLDARTYGYLSSVASQAAYDCQRLNQSGFVIVWTSDMWSQHPIVSTTLFTVNQHWAQDERLPSDYQTPKAATNNFQRKHAALAKAAEHAARQHNVDPDDVFSISVGAEAARKFYPMSLLSYNVLERQRSRTSEAMIAHSAEQSFLFETGSESNLECFLLKIQSDRGYSHSWIRRFVPFGEMAEYLRTCTLQLPWPDDFGTLSVVLEGFRHYKIESINPAPSTIPPT